MVMKKGTAFGAHLGVARMPMTVNVLEDRQAEADNSFGPFCPRWRLDCLNRAKQVVNATRPDIDTSPVHVYGLIGRIQMQCTAFIEEVLEPFGLTSGTFDVLTALRRAGSPYCLSPKQIAQSLLLSGAGLTSRLHKLEAQNFLARLPEPDDRRTLRVQLTAAGEIVINEAIPRVFEAQRSRLLPLGGDGQRRLVQELARFAEVIDSWPSVPAQPQK